MGKNQRHWFRVRMSGRKDDYDRVQFAEMLKDWIEILLSQTCPLSALAGHLTGKRQGRISGSILRETYVLQGAPKAAVGDFVAYWNQQRYHETLKNLMLANVDFGRGQTILFERRGNQKKDVRRAAPVARRIGCLNANHR